MTANATSETKEDKGTQTKPLSFSLVRRIFSSLGHYSWLMLLAFLLVCICIWADLRIIREVANIIGRDDLFTESVLIIITPLLIVCLINRLAGWIQWNISIYAANKAIYKLRIDFFCKLQSLSRSFHNKHKTGWLVARSTGDLAVLSDFLTFALMMIGVFVTATGFALYEICRLSPILLFPAFLLAPIIVALTIWFKRRMSKIQRTAREQNSRLVANMSESVRGVKVVHAFTRQEHNLDAFNELNRMSHDTEIRAARLHSLFLPSMDFLGILNTTIVVAVAAWLINNPDLIPFGKALTPADIVAYIMYMTVILWPIRMLVELYSMAIRSMAAAERIFEIIDLQPEIKDPHDPILKTPDNYSVSFKDVDFRYEESEPWILRKLSFEIGNGETVALAGSTGAGKTTVSSLLARFHDTTNGIVSVGGNDVRLYRQDDLHQMMGVVLQDGFLFSGTVFDNLRFRQPDMSDEEVIETAKQLGTHDVIMALSHGYNTVILEGGKSISEGQRQAISITRALIANPRILILDEPTSSLDMHTERVIQTALDKLIHNRTTLVIAHRLSTIRNADRIIVLDCGQIREQGSHDELMSLKGEYAKLVNNSYAGFLK